MLQIDGKAVGTAFVTSSVPCANESFPDDALIATLRISPLLAKVWAEAASQVDLVVVKVGLLAVSEVCTHIPGFKRPVDIFGVIRQLP